MSQKNQYICFAIWPSELVPRAAFCIHGSKSSASMWCSLRAKAYSTTTSVPHQVQDHNDKVGRFQDTVSISGECNFQIHWPLRACFRRLSKPFEPSQHQIDLLLNDILQFPDTLHAEVGTQSCPSRLVQVVRIRAGTGARHAKTFGVILPSVPAAGGARVDLFVELWRVKMEFAGIDAYDRAI